MIQSKLCKICANERAQIEIDGYLLYSTDKGPCSRIWYYRHCNGNRLVIELNLDVCRMTIYKNSKVSKIVE